MKNKENKEKSKAFAFTPEPGTQFIRIHFGLKNLGYVCLTKQGIGYSWCAKEDQFFKRKGRYIAYQRAKSGKNFYPRVKNLARRQTYGGHLLNAFESMLAEKKLLEYKEEIK